MQKDYQYLYNDKRWQLMRRKQLSKQPLCEISLALGQVVEANVVDHVKPHKGNKDLFFDPNNLMSVAKEIHDSVCQQMESGTYQLPIGVDGWPIENEFLKKIYNLKKPKTKVKL